MRKTARADHECATWEQLGELQRTASRARGIGLDVDVIGADEAQALMPAVTRDDLYGAVYLPGDGHLDPHEATHALADAARALGVRIRQGVRVTGFELSPRRDVRRVLTDAGPEPRGDLCGSPSRRYR